MKLLRENKNKTTSYPNKVGPGSRTNDGPLDLFEGVTVVQWLWRIFFTVFSKVCVAMFFHICGLKSNDFTENAVSFSLEIGE